MRIPRSDDRFDGAISIEAMPHAPDKVAAYSEIFRVLRPAAGFACYEWCLTDVFDPSNAEHVQILRVAEPMRLVPQGTRAVSTFLNWEADTLVEGGRTGTFTPMFFFLARKP